MAILSAALCPAMPARGEDLLLNASGGHIVEAKINNVVLRLRVALDAHGFIVLNRAAAHRARLGHGRHGSVMVIGPVRLKGRGTRERVVFSGPGEILPLSWYEAAVDEQADGVISPALLPYDRVRLLYGPSVVGERETTYQVQLSDGDGLHVPVGVGGAHSIAVRFSPTAPQSVAAGAAAAMMAETHNGTLAPDNVHLEIGFGISRPARWLILSTPVHIGDRRMWRVLMRTGDFLGKHALPRNVTTSANDDIVVTAAGDRQGAVYRMTLGTDVLGACSEAEYRRVERSLTLRCQ